MGRLLFVASIINLSTIPLQLTDVYELIFYFILYLATVLLQGGGKPLFDSVYISSDTCVHHKYTVVKMGMARFVKSQSDKDGNTLLQ